MTIDESFSGHLESRRIFDALLKAICTLGSVDVRVTKSQIAFRRNKAFAWAWMPDMYVKKGHAPLVLTMAFRKRNRSKRWKQVVEPAQGRFTHHLELYSESEIDDEVRHWLRAAWKGASD